VTDEVVLRAAEHADVPAMMAIRHALRLRPDAREGFLLGTTEAGYHAQIEAGVVQLLVFGGAVVGFATALPDAVLRASPLWQRRPQVAWAPGFAAEAIEAAKIGYFDQLAVLPGAGPRRYAAALGLRTLAELLRSDHEHVLTTTVETPIVNRAAHAFLARVGARRIGVIDEVYPEVGPLTSALYHLSAAEVRARVAAARESAGPLMRRVLELAGV
jgi:hypothetical protein